MNKKYGLTDDSIEIDGHVLYRIRSLRSADLGGYVESEDNLSHMGNCWICKNAKVFGNAHVNDNAQVYGFAQVFGNARISEYAEISGNSKIFECSEVSGDVHIDGYARVFGNAHISGDVRIYGYSQIYGDAWIVDVDNHVRLYGRFKIDHGVWDRQIYIGSEPYLISRTLEKLFIGK